MSPIYLDYNGTTPLDPEVIAVMRTFMDVEFGNPSSSHAYGRAAHEAVQEARSRVAHLLGCSAATIVFTASGSEADNLAIKGVAEAYRGEGLVLHSACQEDYRTLAAAATPTPPGEARHASAF